MSKESKRCEACADGFISTHEKAANDCLRKGYSEGYQQALKDVGEAFSRVHPVSDGKWVQGCKLCEFGKTLSEGRLPE